MDFTIPEYVNKILKALMAAGYDAYLVGGAVRDLLLEKEPAVKEFLSKQLRTKVLALSKSWARISVL